MKRMVFTLMVIACTAAIYGQKQQVDDFFSKYSEGLIRR